MPVARRRPQLAPRVLLVLLLEVDGLLDLVELDIDEVIVQVSLGVDVGQDLLGLGRFALGDEPTGRLGDGPARVLSECFCSSAGLDDRVAAGVANPSEMSG